MVSGLNYTVLIITFACVDERLQKLGKVVSVSSFFPCPFSMTAFFSLQYSARLQASTSLSARSFFKSILFLHLKALSGGELRLVRAVGMVGLND